jgi:hypothetical protein
LVLILFFLLKLTRTNQNVKIYKHEGVHRFKCSLTNQRGPFQQKLKLLAKI